MSKKDKEKFYFGAHISITYGLIEAAKIIKKSGGNLLQIFLSSPRRPIKPGKHRQDITLPKRIEDINQFKKYLKKNDMKVVVHSSYLHNIARNWDKYSWWVKNLELEIEYCYKIGAIGLVLHFGNSLDLEIPQAYNNMYSLLVHLHAKTIKYKKVLILLETSTGQGTEMCYKLEDLAYFYKKISKNINKELRNRIKICIDTCHIFSAGYDISNKDKVQIYLEAFEELIGLRHVKLIHLNDSKVNLGTQKDRHDNIGRGFIKYKGLKYFFEYFKKLGIPIILETPNEGFREEISLLNK